MLSKRYKRSTSLDSVIDLEKLNSGQPKCIERDASQLFSLTYPTKEFHSMFRILSRRFDPTQDQTESSAGLILAEGVKGQGKSHALLVAYHLFANQEMAKPWLESLGYFWNPPNNTLVLVEKFTDQYLPFNSLWFYLGNKLQTSWDQDRPPSLTEFRTALADRHVVLIFDELERGITNIPDASRRSQNLSFLQMISEEANRNQQVTLVAAIYDGAVDPGATLKRIPRLELRFRNSEDRAAIVRHRLFSNAQSYDRKAAEDLIQSYVNTWKRLGAHITDEYMARLQGAFPFLPELMDLIFERIGGGDIFQGTRGALGLLGGMLDAAGPNAGLLTAAHCKLSDQGCADRLQDLDPSGATITCATGNLRELKTLPYSEALASATLLASLVPTEKARGVSKDELIRHVAEPGCDPNQFEATLEAFRRYGSYFHLQEDRFYFDIEENENAKVELEAHKSGNEEMARQQIGEIWLQGIFKEWQQAIIFLDQETTQIRLNNLQKRGPRFLLAPRRLSNLERHALYLGAEQRNQIILLEPREDRANHLTNADLLTFAKRYAAANALQPTGKTAERRDRYERIANQERKMIVDTIKQAGLVYTRVERWAETSDQTDWALEPLGQATSREEVVHFIRTQIFPQTLFAEHLRERLTTVIGQRVDQVDRLYRTTLGYPVPLKEDMVVGAILMLVEDRDGRPLGFQGPRGRSFCGERVDLSPSEIDEAILSPPWPESATPTSPPVIIPPFGPKPEEREPETPFPSPEPPLIPSFEERGTPICRSLGELRQQVASRLNDLEGPGVLQISFRILANAQDIELSGLHSGIRGALTGKGTIDVQIELTCPGPMTKADAEGRCEKLPTLHQASYSATMRIAPRESCSE